MQWKMNASIVNNVEGDIIEKASTVSRKRLFDVTKPVRAARCFNRSVRNVYRKKRQKFKKKWKPCYICADPGHSGNFCPQVNTCSVCSKEETKNNVEEDHTSIFCLKCGSTGHGMLSCTNDYDPEDLKGIQCYICMDFGHLCCTENSTEGPIEVSCYNCGQSGHHGFECTKMNAVANKLQTVSVCFKCQKGVHSPKTWDLDNKSTSAKTISLGKDEVMDKSMKEKSLKTQLNLKEATTSEKDAVPDKSITRMPRRAQSRELDNKSTSSKIYTAGKDSVLNNTVKENSGKAQIAELDNKSTSAETTLLGKDAVLNKFVKKKSPKTQTGEKVNKSTSAESGMVRKDAVPDKSIERTSQKTRRRERRRKRKPVMPASNVVQSLPTMSTIGYTIPRCGQYYGNPISNVWLSPPAAAARNCLVNSPAINQSSYGRPGLSPPAAAARNYLEISPAVDQFSYQTGFHFSHYYSNYIEATQVPPNPFHPRSLLPHEIFHQGTQIPEPPQNRVLLPHQNFIHQIRTHVPRSTFDSQMGISPQPGLPHHVPDRQISASLPHQKLQHQLSSHRTWMAPPGWKPYS